LRRVSAEAVPAGRRVVGREVLQVDQEEDLQETDRFRASRVVVLIGHDPAVIVRRRRLALVLIFFRQRCGLATA
jgi:hypothetical protein